MEECGVEELEGGLPQVKEESLESGKELRGLVWAVTGFTQESPLEVEQCGGSDFSKLARLCSS